MRLGDRNHPVQAFASNRSDETFADRVRLRARDRRSQHLEAQGANRTVQVPRVDRVTIVNQVLVVAALPEHLSQLLQRPLRARVRGHVQVRQAARAVLDDDEHVQHAQCGRDGHKEIARDERRLTTA